MKSKYTSATLLLMADSAMGGTIVDPLDANVNDIDTSRPRLPKKNYELKITKAETKEVGEQKDKYVVLSLATTQDATSTDGEPIKAGHLLSHRINTTVFENRTSKKGSTYSNTIEDVRRGMAEVAQAAGLNCSVRSLIDNPKQLEGATVRCEVGIQDAKDGFPESNRINSFINPAKKK